MITNNRLLVIAVFFCLFYSCKKEELPEQFGTFTDARDNHEYKWVRIGNQVWMAENFAYSTEIYPDTVNSGIWVARFKWIMPMSVEEKQKVREERGCLYSWEKAKELCPAGWHLPSDEEWMELEQNLGMKTEELTKEGERGVDERIGGQLKETGTLFWYPPNRGATNTSGFAARPSGHHNYFARYPDATFKFYDDYFNDVAFYWTSSSDGENVTIRYLHKSNYGIFRRKFSKNFGYSVRYVKNN